MMEAGKQKIIQELIVSNKIALVKVKKFQNEKNLKNK